jgi:hypothetical protein
MKRFNRKKLIPSLAASVMVAAATFAPLSGFLAAGSVHAHAAFPARNFIEIHREAEFITSAPPDETRVNVVSTYRCAPNPTAAGLNTSGFLTVRVIQGSTAGSGSTTMTPVSGGPSPIMCDGHVHKISTTVIANLGQIFQLGDAAASATLYNSSGIIGGIGKVASDTDEIHIGQ